MKDGRITENTVLADTELAAATREVLYGDQDAEELDRILAEIEGLSEDEVNEKLAEAEQRSGR